MTQPFFPGFRVERLAVSPDTTIHAEVGGEGPPLLLLHGYPQTHVAWHRVAPELARHFTVVAPDLRGYGDSTGPAGDPEHLHYSKRAMGEDMQALMRSLGFARFAVLAHDRGARVGYRLALDQPAAVSCFSSLTVIPTQAMWERADMAFGLKAYHWFLFAQPHDLPERLLAADPAYFLRWTLDGMVKRANAVTPQAFAEYLRAFERPQVRHAMIEDYRAAASVDLAHDHADSAAARKLRCPVQVLWSQGPALRTTPVETWRAWAHDVEGAAVACGHLMAEEAPNEVLAHVLPFLRQHAA